MMAPLPRHALPLLLSAVFCHCHRPAPTQPTPTPGRQQVAGFDDEAFARAAASDGMFVVAASELVVETTTGASGGFTEGEALESHLALARRLADEHRKLNLQLKQVADAQGWTLPSAIDPRRRDLLRELETASPGDLGTRFATIQQRAHEDVIASFDDCARRCRDARLRALARDSLPLLRSHLAAIVDRL